MSDQPQAGSSDEAPLRFTLSLNVLNHLGLNLYSSIPAVLTEAVANSWDAGALNVDISWTTKKVDSRQRIDQITIFDDGSGMTRSDVADRYLTVGYQRRKAAGGSAVEVPAVADGDPNIVRPVMGRKGIGKLSLFSIAETVEVHSARDGEKVAFRMSLADIRSSISSSDADASHEGSYEPDELDAEKLIDFEHGTRIVLTDLRRTMYAEGDALRRKLARRFSVTGSRYRFEIAVNGKRISPSDRGYYSNVEYLWALGPTPITLSGREVDLDGRRFTSLAAGDGEGGRAAYKRAATLTTGGQLDGWIGTVATPSQARDGDENLNRIVLMVRGRVAQEDLLERFNDGGIYTKYVMGEVHADFLDSDEEDDIATSSRQALLENDPRFEAVVEAVRVELANIASKWSDLRGDEGGKKADEIPEIRAWRLTLNLETRKKADRLFGKINQLQLTDEERRRLFRQAVIAFETFRYKESLDTLDSAAAGDISALLSVFSDIDQVEGALYHQIVTARLEVINTLREKVDTNELEKVIQQYLWEHLWLLDPAWERATETPVLEESVKKEFGDLDAKLSKDEAAGRMDIRYQKVSGVHVIIELKRPEVKATADQLAAQIGKYSSALRKVLAAHGRQNEPVESICIVGKPYHDKDDPDGLKVAMETLKAKGARAMTYGELLDGAQKGYSEFLQHGASIGRLKAIIDGLD